MQIGRVSGMICKGSDVCKGQQCPWKRYTIEQSILLVSPVGRRGGLRSMVWENGTVHFSVDENDGVLQCVRLRWQKTAEHSCELSFAANCGLVSFDWATGFVNLIGRNFMHKHLNGTSWRKNCLKLLCGEEDNCVPHMCYVNRFYHTRIEN